MDDTYNKPNKRDRLVYPYTYVIPQFGITQILADKHAYLDMCCGTRISIF
jgi:hypothetical protein